MKKSAKAKTPKKEEAHKKSCTLKNDLECSTKNFALDLKSWTESLTTLDANIEQIDKVIQKTATMTPQELSKAFSDTQSRLDRIKTKIEAQQKTFNAFQTKFETTLAVPLKTGSFNGLKEEVLKEVRENIAIIEAGITANTQSLNVVAEKSVEQTRKLVLLEESVIEICLPDEVEKIDKLQDKLIKYLTTLCEMTAPTKLPENEAAQKATVTRNEKLKKPFLQAYAQHCEATKLFELIRKNIRIPLPEEEKVAEPNAVQPDAAQPDKIQVSAHMVH